MWTWTRKIILSFSGNPRFHPIRQKLSLETRKLLEVTYTVTAKT